MKLMFKFLLFSYSMNIALAQDAELCPPGGLNVFGGDGQNVISWSEPIGNIGCGVMGLMC